MENVATGHYRNSARFLFVNAFIYFGHRMSFCSACCPIGKNKTRYFIFSCVHQRPVLFSCVAVSDIEDLPPAVQEKLFDEVLDRDVQKGDFPCCYGNRDHFRRLGNRIHDVLYQDICQTLAVLCYQCLCCQPSLHTVLTLAGCQPSPWILPAWFNHLSGDLLSLLQPAFVCTVHRAPYFDRNV